MLLWTNIKQKNLQICIDHAPSCIHFCKKKCTEEGVWLLYIFFHNHNYQGCTGKFIYKALILDNKQLLSNMIDREAAQVTYTTRNAFLTVSYIFCSNHPAILCIIAIASFIAIWRQHFWTKTWSSYVYRFLAKCYWLQIYNSQVLSYNSTSLFILQ